MPQAGAGWPQGGSMQVPGARFWFRKPLLGLWFGLA
jgi:hypothetical protein